jgi:hypothetical protein
VKKFKGMAKVVTPKIMEELRQMIRDVDAGTVAYFPDNKNLLYGLNGALIFGKYKGKKITDVIRDDCGYLVWAVNNLDTFYITERVAEEIKRVMPIVTLREKQIVKF